MKRSVVSHGVLALHRYLGVAVGVLMTLWCLSGFVMMYQGFPALTDEERLAGLEPLDLSGDLGLDRLPFADGDGVGAFRLEMLAGRPVLRLDGALFDLRTGAAIPGVSTGTVAAIARSYAAGQGIARHGAADLSRTGPPDMRLMDRPDQWTVQTWRRARPVYHVRFGDPAGSEIYVSAASGEVIQDTRASERFWSWLGAIPHWLYPTLLRQNGALWTQVVIWTSAAGVFLTATGLYVGLARLRRLGRRGASPFRGLRGWHHMTGLVFGVLTLTWVFSGLMTMNPWGLLVSPPDTLRRDIAGPVAWAEARAFIDATARAPQAVPDGVVRIRSAPLGGRLHALADIPAGPPTRLDQGARPRPLRQAEARAALGPRPLLSFELLTAGDAYHYGFKARPAPPAYRAVLDDGRRTRVYIDAATGEVTRVADGVARRSRWLRDGLHSLDFIPGRPAWDAVVLLLLAGVTAVCATGTWMSFRRVRRDARALASEWPRRPVRAPGRRADG